MKKVIISFLAVITITVLSCKKITDFNVDTKQASEVTSASLISNAMKNLTDQVTSSSVNFNVFRAYAQYWTETTYPDESNYDINTRQISDYEFRTMYRDVLSNLNEAERIIPTETEVVSTAEERANKMAVAEILSVYTFQRLVDIYGNVPYSQALDINVLNPAYDDAQTIYADLFRRVDAAIAMIDENTSIPGDLIYDGDMAMWKVFANSLKLKLAINAADVPALNPAQKAAEAVAAGVMASSDDDAKLFYLTTQPNTNPVYVEIVVSGRNDWVAANTIVDTMNAMDDPRRQFYFDDNIDTAYVGGIYGSPNSFRRYTHVSPTLLEPTYPGKLITYTEVLFYLAEAAERGFISGSAETYYNEGITNSIKEWGGTDGDVAAYLANPKVAFSYPDLTNLEKIALQSWIASYDRGLLGWTTWRRLDFPTFNIPPLADAVPTRFTYPATEQTLNPPGYSSGSGAIGGDSPTTKIFWDKYSAPR